MSNLTLTVEERLLRRARLRALEQGTSVNAVVREFLERYVEPDRERDALRALAELADGSEAGSGSGGRSWTRDDLYA